MAHNRIHSHEAWNKDIKTPKNTVFKQRQAREKTFLKKAEKTYQLYLTGLIQREIADIQGITRSAVSLRIKKYKEKLCLKI
jgi:DNA-directed RNA polymerase specialized sigma subunit